MSHKSQKISQLIEGFQGQDLDAHYLAYFECFNRQLFFEAHEVLEDLWLSVRGQEEDLFYKGLIQLAGAFVHLQKRRPGPAAALFRLASHNLRRYGSPHARLDVVTVLTQIESWLHKATMQVSGQWTIDPKDFPQILLQLHPD